MAYAVQGTVDAVARRLPSLRGTQRAPSCPPQLIEQLTPYRSSSMYPRGIPIGRKHESLPGCRRVEGRGDSELGEPKPVRCICVFLPAPIVLPRGLLYIEWREVVEVLGLILGPFLR